MLCLSCSLPKCRRMIRCCQGVGVVWFSAVGRENCDPYLHQLYRVRLDGSDLTLLTGAGEEDGEWQSHAAKGPGPNPSGRCAANVAARLWPSRVNNLSCRALPSLTTAALAAQHRADRPRAGGAARLGRSAVAERRLHRRDGVLPQPAAAADCPLGAERRGAAGVRDGGRQRAGGARRAARAAARAALRDHRGGRRDGDPRRHPTAEALRPNALLSDRGHLLYARMTHTRANRSLIARLLLRTDPGPQVGRATRTFMDLYFHKPSGWGGQALAELGFVVRPPLAVPLPADAAGC